MKKNLSVILITLMMLLGTCAIAADSADIVYDGKALVNTSDADLSDSISGLLPGETKNIDITFANNSSNKTNWYITNKILSSFEDKGAAENGGYTYALIYIDPTGAETTLYSNDHIGGEVEEMEAGLKQINSAVGDNYFYLGSLDANKSGTIRIRIGLDGESQSNSYMDAVAELQLSFAVEEEVSNTTRNVIRYYVPNTSSGAGIFSANYTTYYMVFAGGLLLMVLSLSYLIYARNREEK